MENETFSEVISIIQSAGYDVRKYSGRGMCGRHCVGVECEDVTSFIMDLFYDSCNYLMSTDSVAEFIDRMRHYSSDSLGRGYIVFWPGIDWEEEEEEEEEEDNY